MLRTSDVARMRAVQEMALPDVCTRTRPTYTKDGLGGRVESGEDTLENIPCRISVLRWPRDIFRANGSALRVSTVVTVPNGTDVVETDRLEVVGRTWEVVGFMSIGAWETALRCLCMEMT